MRRSLTLLLLLPGSKAELPYPIGMGSYPAPHIRSCQTKAVKKRAAHARPFPLTTPKPWASMHCLFVGAERCFGRQRVERFSFERRGFAAQFQGADRVRGRVEFHCLGFRRGTCRAGFTKLEP